ncbi:putative FYVE zinc finger, protein-tyrosine phosphatase, catalytic, Zinc finger, FYVE/PHD-type [Plasmopara halstedii]
MLPTRASPSLQVSPVITSSTSSSLLPPKLHLNPSKTPKHHPQPKSAPGHRRRHIVAWVPDSLAEKCYSCQTAFSLMLRRHHCRRCGNVFCDACSSARMPLVNSGFVTPVRVCAKCSIAAKKAHAKMVQERQKLQIYEPPRRHSDIADREELTKTGFWFNGTNDTIHRFGERRRRASEYQESLDFNSCLIKGGIITSNGRREMALSPVFAQEDSRIERLESEETEYSSGPHEQSLQTLPGEAVLVKNGNVRIRFMERIEHLGTLYVTNYRLVFSPGSNHSINDVVIVNGMYKIREDTLPYASDVHTESIVAYQAIPLMTIDLVKRKETVETDSGSLEVIGKDFRRLHFVFDGLVSKQTFSKFDRTYALLQMHALGKSDSKLDEFARFSLERFDGIHGAIDGWQIYNAVEDFKRMGISSSTNRWRLSYANDQYELCPTYPSILAVPSSVSDSLLAVASKFRSKGRIPVLSWRDRHTGAVICRSSQPLVGLGQKQCDKDVFLIQAIAATNPSSSKLVIIDARPWKNAVAQKAVGRAGYELTEHYETRHATSSLKYVDMVASEHTAAAAAAISTGARSSPFRRNSVNGELETGSDLNTLAGDKEFLETKESALVLTECKLIFMGIENIHTMRKSYHKLMDLCTIKQNNDKWLDQLASTHWLNHISRILDSAVEIVRIVKEQKSSVLIHCSDGWDRTAQLTALSEVLIDPHYRTIIGFERLIEKEWCSFGHKFRERTYHGASNNVNETSPIFLQWIDCVWQVMAQFPSAFEFNERFLILILDHLYSCRFGTFLYNSQRERMEQESCHPTHSLWSYLSTVERAIVVNPFYKPHNAPRMKWKESITATRQCYEKSLDQSIIESSLSRSARICYDHSMMDDFVHYQRNAFDASDWYSPSSNVSGAGTVFPPSALSQDNETEADFDAELSSTHEQLSFDFQQSYNDNADGNELNHSINHSESKKVKVELSGFHKLVRDLDTGISFPQLLDTFTFSTPLSSPVAKPRSESLLPDRSATDCKVMSRPSTPKLRSSLTSRVMSAAVERAPLSLDGLWNTLDADASSDGDDIGRFGAVASCENVIVPSCSMKSLAFWSNYYLRWDPSSHFDRDASVEIETLHLDVIMRLKKLTKQVETNQTSNALKKSTIQTNCHCEGNTNLLLQHKKLLEDSVTSQDSELGADGNSTIKERIAMLKEQKLRRLEEVEADYQNELACLMEQLG